MRLKTAVLLLLSLTPNAWSATIEMPLRENAFVRTAAGRERLKYLVSCALPKQMVVVAASGKRQWRFRGDLAIAPHWNRRALTEAEERRVSACMFARTNFYGVPVKISLRNEMVDQSAQLAAHDDERRRYPFFEAGFFGNLFGPNIEAYVCNETLSPARRTHLLRMRRVCSLPGKRDGLSLCGFAMVGACEAPHLMQNGVDYSADVIKVYLPAP